MTEEYEKSCGAIVFHKFEDEYKILILNFNHEELNFWGFPKGHVEINETEIQTAKREIKEKTGLEVKIIPDFRASTEFIYENGRRHKVIYFAAESTKTEINPQNGEEKETVVGSKWWDLPIEEINSLIPILSDSDLDKVKAFLKGKLKL